MTETTCDVCGKPGWIVAGLCESCRWFLFLTEKDLREITARIDAEKGKEAS